ncbi:hypothetical protein [uncultured Thiocystis sp.]|jgi:hypothetical protein|uniref:hypothetical protein n=1 Tax=uncultured Thiocystis sp. TaxID=1202134 RepID=UPI0025FF07D7|nr:hypothetical protein [uncultured Thiocystis sp.]
MSNVSESNDNLSSPQADGHQLVGSALGDVVEKGSEYATEKASQAVADAFKEVNAHEQRAFFIGCIGWLRDVIQQEAAA